MDLQIIPSAIDDEIIELANEIEEQTAKGDLQEKPIVRIKKYLLSTYDFYFNQVSLDLLFKPKKETKWQVFDRDRQLNNIVYDLKASGFSRPKEDIETILNSDAVPMQHPIKDYFANLKPLPGTNNFLKLCSQIELSELDITYEGKTYQELFQEYFLKWLIATYLCANEIKHNDMMFILIGPQGIFKTSFLNYLCPKELQDYRVTGHIVPSITDRNTATFLSEKFLVNIDDQMEKIIFTDYQRMKAIISASDVTYSKKYKNDKKRTRIGNFVGSINTPQFLVDNENRRYLCFQLDNIKRTYTNVDIDKVWSEIKYIASQLPNHFMFGRKEYEAINELNRYFTRQTDEEEILNTVFRPVPENMEGYTDTRVYYMQQSEIFRVIKMYARDTQLRTYNLTAALAKHKYIKISKRLERFGNSPRHLYMIGLLLPEQKILDTTGIHLYEFAERTETEYAKADEPDF